MKFVNEEVKPRLGKSTSTIWLNSQLNIRETLTPPPKQMELKC